MVALAGLDTDPADALADGRAMDHWRAMISAQGGDPDAPLPTAKHTETVRADTDGTLTRLDALSVGIAAWRLGAGRARQGDPVQSGAGIEMHAKPGDGVSAGQPLLTLHTDTPEAFTGAMAALRDAVTIEATAAPDPAALILDRIVS
jgi:thymidine phosphorylase